MGASLPTPDTISVVITDSTEDNLTLARFEWPSQQPHDTYTIDANASLSVELDSHFPVRPAIVRWEHYGMVGDEIASEALFGKDFAEAMSAAHRDLGFTALQLSLSRSNRLAIAELQLHSPSTPTLLKRLCGQMIGELRISQEETAA
jgi:hypothetical protein